MNLSSQRLTWHRLHLDDAARALLDRDASAFLHQSVSTPCLATIAEAEGIWITDTRGRRTMDFHGNNVHHIGYRHPRLLKAVTQQMQTLPFAPRRYTCEVAVELAEKLAAVTPGNLCKVLLAPSGSNAVEMALAYARSATGRFKTLSFWDAFHGAGFGARSVGGEQMFRSGSIGPLLAGSEHVPPFGDYRNAWGVTRGSADLCARQIRYVLEKEGDIAAVIAEPTRAVPYIPPPGFWQQVRQACDACGTLLIFDEIPTGLGKTGRLFACEHEDVVPDILVLGKGLGGGLLPIAAMVCRPDLDIGQAYAHGHYTHEKNPVCARAALTTLEIIEDEGLVAHAARVGTQALERLQTLQENHPLIGDVRGRGCLLGVELVRDRDTREPAFHEAETVLYEALARGLSFKTTMGNILTLTPPLIVTPKQMDRALDILDESLTVVENRVR
jgi:4-aminobutyrate aminotransferase